LNEVKRTLRQCKFTPDTGIATYEVLFWNSDSEISSISNIWFIRIIIAYLSKTLVFSWRRIKEMIYIMFSFKSILNICKRCLRNSTQVRGFTIKKSLK
jgi:hypothetical protein